MLKRTAGRNKNGKDGETRRDLRFKSTCKGKRERGKKKKERKGSW